MLRRGARVPYPPALYQLSLAQLIGPLRATRSSHVGAAEDKGCRGQNLGIEYITPRQLCSWNSVPRTRCARSEYWASTGQRATIHDLRRNLRTGIGREQTQAPLGSAMRGE